MTDKGAENIFDAYLGPKRINHVNTWDMPNPTIEEVEPIGPNQSVGSIGPNPPIEEVGQNPPNGSNIQDMDHVFLPKDEGPIGIDP